MPVHFCPKCKSLVKAGRDICQFCGTPVDDEYETPQLSLFEVEEDTPEPQVLENVNEQAPYLPY